MSATAAAYHLRNPTCDIPGDPDQGVADFAKRQIALADRKIDKVDIDRDARKIPDEELLLSPLSGCQRRATRQRRTRGCPATCKRG